jgi:protein-S-isoprenylcysteine O-methyltransferase
LGRLPQAAIIGAVGVGLMVLGLAIRLCSMNTLGVFYTRSLRVSEGQAIVESGPYRWIRHPGYLGSLLVWLGLPISLANWMAAGGVLVLMGAAYARRIRAGEAMLVEGFGSEY